MIKKELYTKTEWCMNFTNKEIMEYFVQPLTANPDINIKLLSDDREIKEDSNENIEIVCLDGEKEELFVSFIGCQTSIFILNEEVMFIDENAKKNYTLSDTAFNIVYEGNLRGMTHKEILKMLLEFVNYCVGAYEIYVEEDNKNYIINLKSNKYVKNNIYYNNIHLHIQIKNINLIIELILNVLVRNISWFSPID